jgi:hypothetical protein
LSLLHAYRLQHNLRRFALSHPESFSVGVEVGSGRRFWDRAVISHVLPVPAMSRVEVYTSADRSLARYGNLIDANSWRSPVSAYYKSREMARRLEFCSSLARRSGLTPHMVTLTLRHSRADSLALVLQTLRDAWAWFSAGGWWSSHRPSLPVVRRLEITWSAANGWHPHLHLLCFFSSSPDVAAWRARWVAAVQRSGGDALPDVGLDVRVSDDAVSSYVSKLHLEMASPLSKSGGLSIYAMLEQPDRYAPQVLEYYASTRRVRFVGGVSQLMRALGVSDADIPAEDPTEWMLCLSLTVDQYMLLVDLHLAVDFLVYCLSCSDPAFTSYMQRVAVS